MKISVLGLWRDSANHAQRTLDNLGNIVADNPNINFEFFFYENDSMDNTKEILENWIKNYNGKIFSEQLGFPKFGSVIDVTRLVLLSYYRNKLKELCLSQLRSDYTLLIDTDIVFDNSHFKILMNNILNLNAAMVVANTRQNTFGDLMYNESNDTFYDAAAFKDRYNQDAIYFTDCPLVLSQDRASWKHDKPVKIGSGFSGFSLIKTEILKKCKWSVVGNMQNVEHVNFCYEVNNYGDIFIIPSCKPFTQLNKNTLNIPVIKEYALAQIEKINNINQIYITSISSKLENQSNE